MAAVRRRRRSLWPPFSAFGAGLVATATSAKLLQSGAAFLGTTRANVLILLGACKLLALLDLWVLNAMPRITCLCVAVMMGAHRAHPLASRHLLL